MEPISSDHSRVDERSLAMHRPVVEKVRAAPALLDMARKNLRRWQKTEGSLSLTLAEGADILKSPANQVTEFLEERSERAARLRQSCPFAGILTDTEGRSIYESYSTRTYYSRRHPSLG